MKRRTIISVLIVCIAAFAVYSASKNNNFKPAEDFPREALIYAQVSDLPEFVKLLNESKFKEKFAESYSFQEFTNNHLGLKLASRLQEFSDAAGFPIDLDVASDFAGKNAAFALYDIGKIEFVFIAPVSDEVFAATKFVQNQDKFEEQTLDDGTSFYRVKVEADRGRQKQELIFANVKGRFVLATSEKLLRQTLHNISGDGLKNRLFDEPTFSDLSAKIEPHLATVWVNQTALNDDYYFKHYWLMSNVKDLKNIRAGMFDLSIDEGQIIEHRKFLLGEKIESSPINAAQEMEITKFLPSNTAFYRLQKSNEKSLDDAVRKTIFDGQNIRLQSADKSHSYDSSFDETEDYSSGSYTYLSESFDEEIDENDESETVERVETSVDFSAFLQSSKPQTILTFTRPQVLPAPLFIEFNRAAIFDLTAPANFNRDDFETAIALKFAEQTTISASGIKLKWETKVDNGISVRELNLPMLGFSVNYCLRGDELVLSNNANFLREINVAKSSSKLVNDATIDVENKVVNSPFNELTVINLSERENAYDSIFAELDKNGAGDVFFTGNISSLIDSISDVKKIEIRHNFSGNFLDETIVGTF